MAMFKDFKYNVGDKVIYKNTEHTVMSRALTDYGDDEYEHMYRIKNSTSIYGTTVNESLLSPGVHIVKPGDILREPSTGHEFMAIKRHYNATVMLCLDANDKYMLDMFYMIQIGQPLRGKWEFVRRAHRADMYLE